MNYKLLIYFLLFEIGEFTAFWLIADYIPLALTQLQIFIGLIVIDVIVTKIVFPGAFITLYRNIFNKPN
jgi:hypothetical protein